MVVAVVQSASRQATATTVTATFAAPTTASNTVCASVGASDGSVSGYTVALTLGSSPDNWYLHRQSRRSTTGSNIYAAAWGDASCAGGQTTVTVTLAGATGGFETCVMLDIWEVSGLPSALEDITGATSGNSGTFTTGAFSPSASTSAADEFWWGTATIENGSLTITGPAGWSNAAQLVTSIGPAMMGGYQATTATGSPVYAGTISGSGTQWAVAGATLKAGTAEGTAGFAGRGTLGATGGVGGTAALHGTGTDAGAGSGAPPDSAPLIGHGTLAAAAQVVEHGAAAFHGTGGLAGIANDTPPAVVNQWSGSRAQPSVFGPAPPSVSSVVVALTPAASVGGGSGVPSAGNWLFCCAGWRQWTGEQTISVGDDSHMLWRPGKPSPGTGDVRCAIWYQPNIIPPGTVFVAPLGPLAALAVLVVEVSGLGSWDDLVGAVTAYSASTQSLSMTLTL